jgi:hypothetical protein
MRRWHSPKERALMLRRWRQEIAQHERWRYSRAALAPVPPDKCAVDPYVVLRGLRTRFPDPCHCYDGMGFMRKQRPFGCGRARCQLCHYGKWFPKARHNKRLAAINRDLEDWAS